MYNIGIFGLNLTEDVETYLFPFFDEIINSNKKIFINSEYYQNLAAKKPINQYDISCYNSYQEVKDLGLDIIFSFGGDGTILNVIQYIKDLGIPIIGINTGRLGFLATVQKKDFSRVMKDLLNGKFTISEREMIEITNDLGIDFPYALNDVSISRKETTSMINIDTFVNDSYLNNYWGDGLIIATPTGSTAYSLSCGGPIITPENSNFVITPIAPHNLNVRPILVQNDCRIKLNVSSRVSEFSLTLDSRIYSIPIQNEIHLQRTKFKVKIGFLEDFCYFNILREKLNWGLDTRNKMTNK